MYAGKFVQSLKGYAFLVQGGMHGASQGIMAMMDGGNFFQGFVSGALGSIAASGWTGAFGSGTGGMIAFGALAGGIGAELSGGNFFKGFLQGGIVAGLNHAAHEIGEKTFEKRLKTDISDAGYQLDDIPNMTKEEVYEMIKKVKILNKLYGNEVQVSDQNFNKLPNNNSTYDNNLRIIKGYHNATGFEIVSTGTAWILESSFKSYYTLGYSLGVVKMATFFYWDLSSIRNRSERLQTSILQSLYDLNTRDYLYK